MNEIKVFENENFGKIRVAKKDEKIIFCGIDIANALGYLRPADAISAHCKGVCVLPTPTNGGIQNIKFITEGDVYRLIIKSKLPSAEKFEHWIFDTVLPSINHNGGYIANQENLTPEQIVANALIVAQKIIADKDKIIAEQAPKVEFFDDVTGSSDTIDMKEVAKLLNVKGFGRNNLFELLRNKKILDERNQPYQKYVDAGYFRIIESRYTLPTGEIKISLKTVVFQKGVDFIRKLLSRG